MDISHINQVPLLTRSIEDTTWRVGEVNTLTVPNDTFLDVDGDVLTFAGTLNRAALPAWLSIDAKDGTVRGTPPSDGCHLLRVSATDKKAGSAFVELQLRIGSCPPPAPPPSPGPAPSPVPVPAPAPAPLPTPLPGAGDTLPARGTLQAGEQLVSASGLARLSMQRADGNLVLRRGSAVLWRTGTTGHPGASLHFQASGPKLVVRDTDGVALWSSEKIPGAAKLVLLDDDLVLKNDEGLVLASVLHMASDVFLQI